MPLDTRLVGRSSEPRRFEIDARWLMAYAAGLGDCNPRYLDTETHRVCGHPLFPVCLEWPVVLACRGLPGYDSLTDAEAARGVHASHDLEIHRPIVAGDRLETTATVTGLYAIRPGAALQLRLDTRDTDGDLVCRTRQLAILRGVEVRGEGRTAEDSPEPPKLQAPLAEPRRFAIAVPAGAAHVYTECARIFNPIHTDRAVALAAGLPGLILHGSATLALAVSRLVDECLGGDPSRIRRLGGRFTAMVQMPSTIELVVTGEEPGGLFFSVYNEAGEAAFSDGFVRSV